ncbi:MAG TPA: DUF427 domain-containing protein [Myxococcota bacterium]|jgi:uncharacterized protein (DUF427 family)
MATATWKNTVIAESNDIELVEGNVYFPASAVKAENLQPSTTHTVCSWKGECAYYDVVVGGDVNHDAAWHYDDPKPAAENIKGRIAFWKGVTITR